MGTNAEQAWSVYQRAELIYSRDEINLALDLIAKDISQTLSESDPLVLCVMTGGLMTASEILLRMDFPLEVDYIHATRYGLETQGQKLKWIASPRKPLVNRNILVIDDILDEGHTLEAILNFCREEGASSVYSAVLVQKEHDRNTGLKKADFTAMSVPDRYVFGFGMDYKGYLRNIPVIMAAHRDDE
ncbi:MAG: hypoxanthine-guanine phosphoribosyltransferase [Gammaproteobacteria bacterium]|nr:hypoxanthine-guanine phosphoribosyltransferase [Gammaproteobacteria bacterium]